MTPEWAAVAITIVGVIGTAFNVWLTSRIRADISDLKVWCLETFVRKDDFIPPFQREAMQLDRTSFRNRKSN